MWCSKTCWLVALTLIKMRRSCKHWQSWVLLFSQRWASKQLWLCQLFSNKHALMRSRFSTSLWFYLVYSLPGTGTQWSSSSDLQVGIFPPPREHLIAPLLSVGDWMDPDFLVSLPESGNLALALKVLRSFLLEGWAVGWSWCGSFGLHRLSASIWNDNMQQYIDKTGNTEVYLCVWYCSSCQQGSCRSHSAAELLKAEVLVMVSGKKMVNLSLQLSDSLFCISEPLHEAGWWKWTCYCSSAEVLTALFSTVVSWLKSMNFRSDSDSQHI